MPLTCLQAANLAMARGQMPVEFSAKIGVFLVRLIGYSGKLPSGPVKNILNSQPALIFFYFKLF